MKFSIGDKILVKRTGEEGRVTAMIGKDMLEVEVGGTEFPVHIEDIDHPYLKWFTEKNNKKKPATPAPLPVEKIAERKSRLAKGVYLSFMPVFRLDDMEEVAETLKIFLLNELPTAIKFSYDVRVAQHQLFAHEGTLHGFGNIYLHSIPYADMNDQPRFEWTLADTTNTNMDTVAGTLRIKPPRLFAHINDVLQKSEPTFSYPLIHEFLPKKAAPPPEKFVPVNKQKGTPLVTPGTLELPRYEVDLHIEQLVANSKALSNAEIVQKQLAALEHYLQLALVHRQERMVVIHGLGKGKLRDEVHAILKKMPEIARFKNEWSGKYGFGATEIYFRYL